MTAVQGALGDRDAPLAVDSSGVPSSCYWFTDPDDALCLMPGCMARVQDPEAECTCAKDSARLRSAEVLAVKKLFVPLQVRWWNIVDALHRDPVVRRAFEGLRTCLPAHGVAAADEDAFFGLVDSRLRALDGDPSAAAREDRRLGVVYAQCMAPVEAVREELREQRRIAFLDAHSAEVERLRVVLPERLRQLEERYGIRYGVLVP